VYGRKLSTSARGLLDCLTQLQLIDPAVGQQKNGDQRYEDVMIILQSLWLTEQKNDLVKEQVSPPRSSSGLGMSSGSAGSGKDNGNRGGDETKEASLHEEEAVEKAVEPEETEVHAEAEPEETDVHAEAEPEETEVHAEAEPEETEVHAEAEPEETDVHAEAEPEETEVHAEAEPEETDIHEELVLPDMDGLRNTNDPSSSSANDSSKSPTDNERDTLDDSSSATPPTVVRAPLSKRQSQDPDPVWVMQLLKKLEKQFMDHYITAMSEFKVRWDLDDSLILDTMIGELRDEVSKRIQLSIQRELKKIQGRAGRTPRPPQRGTLSRESTMTDRRRRILKVITISF